MHTHLRPWWEEEVWLVVVIKPKFYDYSFMEKPSLLMAPICNQKIPYSKLIRIKNKIKFNNKFFSKTHKIPTIFYGWFLLWGGGKLGINSEKKMKTKPMTLVGWESKSKKKFLLLILFRNSVEGTHKGKNPWSWLIEYHKNSNLAFALSFARMVVVVGGGGRSGRNSPWGKKPMISVWLRPLFM